MRNNLWNMGVCAEEFAEHVWNKCGCVRNNLRNKLVYVRNFCGTTCGTTCGMRGTSAEQFAEQLAEQPGLCAEQFAEQLAEQLVCVRNKLRNVVWKHVSSIVVNGSVQDSTQFPWQQRPRFHSWFVICSATHAKYFHMRPTSFHILSPKNHHKFHTDSATSPHPSCMQPTQVPHCFHNHSTYFADTTTAGSTLVPQRVKCS